MRITSLLLILISAALGAPALASLFETTIRSEETPTALFVAGRNALRQAQTTAYNQGQADLICSAAEKFLAAAQLSPASPRYIIALADLLVELPAGGKNCAPPLSLPPNASFEPLLNHALALAPADGVNRYLAALAFVRAGDRRRGLELLRIDQEVNPTNSAEQRRYVYNLVRTEADLEAVIPRTYPQVAEWASYFFQQRRADYDLWREVFARAEDSALDNLLRRKNDGKTETSSLKEFVRRLSELQPAVENDQLRRKFDFALS